MTFEYCDVNSIAHHCLIFQLHLHPTRDVHKLFIFLSEFLLKQKNRFFLDKG
jgi:hypothetical protein